MHFRNIYLIAFLALPYCGAAANSAAHGTLFYNGEIRADAGKRSTAQWMWVLKGRIQDLGTGNGIAKHPQAERVDLGKRFVFPGLIDSHAHLSAIGAELSEADLRGTGSAAQAADRVRSHLKKTPLKAGETLVGNGWDQSEWPGQAFPDRKDLDRVAPDRPVVLYRIDGHAAWINTAALKSAHLWEAKSDPSGGKIVREASGRPTGMLIDNAMNEIKSILPVPDSQTRARRILLAVEASAQLGITSVHDAGVTEEDVETIAQLLKQKAIRFRFFEMVSGRDPKTLEAFLKSGPRIDSEDGQLTVRTVKLFIDGAMGSRGAALEAPYSDDPANSGLLALSPTELTQLVKKIDARGFQVAVHAIGDKANHIALDAYEAAMGKSAAARRPRLEHAQVLRAVDIDRIAKLGVIASMQPVHCTSDMKWVEARVGKIRAATAYAWRSVLHAGGKLAFGSDAPYDASNPWWGVRSAVTRQDGNGLPALGFHPEQKLNLHETLRAFTLGGAYAAFNEAHVGSLERGKYADFIVLPADPYELPALDLGKITVEATYVGGEKIWSQNPVGR